MTDKKNFCGRMRREFMWQAGGGFAGTALSGMLGDNFFANQTQAADTDETWENPLAPKKTQFPAKAKSVPVRTTPTCADCRNQAARLSLVPQAPWWAGHSSQKSTRCAPAHQCCWDRSRVFFHNVPAHSPAYSRQ